MRLGPVALTFAGKVELFDIDEANRSARIKAQGSDGKGRGSANATATFRIEPSGGGSRVLIHTDLMLAGAVAQYGRGVGMIQATAAQIIGQFAKNLRAQLVQQPSAAGVAAVPLPTAQPPTAPLSPASGAAEHRAAAPQPSPQPPSATPISGLSLIARVIWHQIVGLFTGRRS